jgi:thiamine-monophosphate kinase
LTGEFQALARLFTMLPPSPVGEVWAGDDAAVVAAPPGPLLLAADTAVEGVHADLGLTAIEDFGWKAVVATLSDIAAMGGRPLQALVTVAAPPGTDLEALYSGVVAAAVRYDCPVVGGDLAGGPVVVVTVAVTGTVDGEPVLRSGARAGDAIWVTGPLGGAAAGLRAIRSGDASEETAPLRRAHLRPQPELREGAAARLAGATAMIDVSDGLLADLGHLADSSGVGFALESVPVEAGATEADALGGGEDYRLVFTAPDGNRLEQAFVGLRPPRRVGVCTNDLAERTFAGRPIPPIQGWEHRF